MSLITRSWLPSVSGSPMGIGSVKFGDSGSVDAFGRLRISEPVTMFDSQLQYDLASLVWDQSTAVSALVTHLPNESAAELSVTATINSKAVRQSRQYSRYRPGKSMLIAITFVMGAGVTDVRKRVGYFDDSTTGGTGNGIFLEQNGTTDVALTRRTYTSGSQSDADRVVQADWNIDPFDGTGPSGVTLDLSKTQILEIDCQWLGVGRVRVGFNIGGCLCLAHEFTHANILETVYCTTMNLPIRYEIHKTATSDGVGTLKQICSCVISEGGYDTDRGSPRGTGNGITAVGVTTRRPILSIRPKTTFNSITNRGWVIPESLEIMATTNSGYWELVYGGTLGGSPSWGSAGDNSIVEKDVAANSISGGEILATGTIVAGAASGAGSIDDTILTKTLLTLDIAGTTATILSLVITSHTGTCNAIGHLRWREYR